MTRPLSPEARAHALLHSLLSRGQRSQLDRTRQFAEGEYLIRLWDGGVSVAGPGGSFCIEVYPGPDYCPLPSADQAVAMLLFIRADPRAFRMTVNRDRVWPRDYLR